MTRLLLTDPKFWALVGFLAYCAGLFVLAVREGRKHVG